MFRMLRLSGAVVLLAMANAIAQTAGPAAWQNDLTPITAADWNRDFAAHLLERAGFGGTPDEIARPREADSRARPSPAWSASKAPTQASCRRSMNPASTIPASNPFLPAAPPSPIWPKRTAKRSASR